MIDRPPKKAKKGDGEDDKKPDIMDESDDWTEIEKEELKLPGYSHGKSNADLGPSVSDAQMQHFQVTTKIY